MSKILVVGELAGNNLSKNTREVLTMATELAGKISGSIDLCIQAGWSEGEIQQYPMDRVFALSAEGSLDSEQIGRALQNIIQDTEPNFILMSGNSLGKTLAGLLSIKLDSGLIGNVVDFSVKDGKVLFKKSVFSGKAFGWYCSHSNHTIISLLPHGYGIKVFNGNPSTSVISVTIDTTDQRIKLLEKFHSDGKMPLTEADVVISGGRGLKDANNWHLIEDLALLLKAGTACSRPVADAGWRPHHEHVGQTGTAIRPNVYIAIGISGAIQHLAGVNNSKKIIVINKDAEAPFFKSADYGICGDLFEVVPKLIESIRLRKEK